MSFIGKIKFLKPRKEEAPDSLKPFIFIAAMPRSGSTLLCGMLTRKPEMIILSEPAFQRGELRELGEYSGMPGLPFEALRPCRGSREKMLSGFKNKLLPSLLKHYRRVGVKECFLDHWELYPKFFPKIKFIVLVRDPGDILLSTLDYGEHVEWHRRMWADKPTSFIAESYARTWEHQKKMIATQECLLLRYEDLCRGEMDFSKIAEFCELPAPERGDTAGAIRSAYPFRAWEVEKHGTGLSAKSIFRWKQEKEILRRKRADEFAERFSDYSAYWGYEINRG